MKKISALLIVSILITQILPIFGLAVAHKSRSVNGVTDFSGPNLDEMIRLIIEGSATSNLEISKNPIKDNHSCDLERDVNSSELIDSPKVSDSSPHRLVEGYYVDDPEKVGSFGNYTMELSRINPGVEIIEKRTPVARHFCKNGSITAYLTISPTSCQDEEEMWHDIDVNGSLPRSGDVEYFDSTWYGVALEIDNDALDPYLWNFQTSIDGNYYMSVGQDLDPSLNKRYYRAFTQWDTSSIPDGSDVTAVELSIYVGDIDPFIGDYVDAYECDMDIYRMAYRPSDYGRHQADTVGRDLFNDAGDGTLYTWEWITQGQGWTDITLGSSAAQDLENQLSANWFAVGFHEYTEHEDGSGEDRGISFNGGSSCDLTVTYIPIDPCSYDEYFYSVSYTAFDSDGDGFNDAVEVMMDVDTTYTGSIDVTVDAYLYDPTGSQVDADYPPFWTITGSEIEYGYTYLYVPSGGQVGWYDVKLYLYDECWNDEDYRYDYDAAFLYPPGYDTYFYDVDYVAFDNDGDGYNDAIEVRMDVDTTDGTHYVTAYGYLREHSTGVAVDSDSSTWLISGTAVEYSYVYLYVPNDSAEGWYDVELVLYDEYGNQEDYRYDSSVRYLYPPNADEYFYSVSYTAFDSDGDGFNDAVEVMMDVDTTNGTINVTVYGYLYDPNGNTVDDGASTWLISATAVEYGYLYLYVPYGAQVGWYDVELYLYDDIGRDEDHRYDNDVAFLYPPSYDVWFYSVDCSGVDDDGDGYHDRIEVWMDVDTTDGTQGVTVDAELYDPNGVFKQAGSTGWIISNGDVEWGYMDFSLFLGEPAGTYTVYLYLYDEWGNYHESYTCYADNVTPPPYLPDLTVGEIWWDPDPPTAGQPFTIEFTICNIGDEDATSWFDIELYIDGIFWASGTDPDGQPSGDCTTWGLSDVVLKCGTHEITVVVDTTNNIDESDEGNNDRTEWCAVEKAEWTLIVYLDADNNLEAAGIGDFLEMSQIGSSQDVSIVVQMDRHPESAPPYSSEYDNWSDCKRFFVTQGMEPWPANAVPGWGGEVNMGDPNVLTDFVEWATDRYQAHHYLLVLWDHGGGWLGGVCVDESDGYDELDMSDLKQAMSAIMNYLGSNLDITGFDACLMEMVEVAYQIRGTTDIIIGSEEVIPGDGWPYDDILADLVASPTIAPSTLASRIINYYIASYQDGSQGTSDFVTLSAFYVNQIVDNVVPAVSSLADRLIENSEDYHSEIMDAIANTESYDIPEYVDLYDFAYEVKQQISDAEIQSETQNVMDSIVSSRLAEGHGPDHLDSHGLSIYLPTGDQYDSSYEDLDFASATRWDEFLKPDLIITVDGTTLPDLTPADPVAGEPIWIWFALNNIGIGDALETFVNKFYIDGSYVAYQEQSGLDTETAVLIYLEITLGPGYHEIRAVADANDDVDESNEGNNEDAKTIWWKSPDLIVQSITTNPEEPVENQPFTIHFTIYNDGDLEADVTFYTQLYIDGMQFSGDFPLSGLAKEASHTFSVPHDGLSQGTHEFEVVTDVYDDVDEANKDTGNGVGTGESNNQMSVWIYFPPHEVVQLNIVHQVQRKDTNMLCLGWGLNGEPYDGQLAWDRPHPTDLTHPTGSLLDDKYCSRASISMIVSYYGGTLSQDRISYYYFEELYGNGVPEGDLGCGSGMPQEEALIWALNGATITYYNGKPSFNQIKQWIDSGRPILRRHVHAEGAHATVIDGYDNLGQRVHLLDPWFTASEYYHEWWADYDSLDVEEVWVPSASATGRSDEGTIWMDSDNDGVCDFDEINRFYTDPYNSDTDGDAVPDKQEIISYTFLSDHSYDASDLRKPDQDGDGHRCELDYDSDNGGVPDGQEDLNGNGFVDPGETDPLDPSDDPNQPPSILDIYPDSETESQGNTIRIFCDSSDPETSEGTLICKIWIKPASESWVVSGETMSWDGNNHYYDWNIPTSAKLGYYDVNCTVFDGELSDWRTDYDEFEVVDTTPPVVQIINPTTSSPIYTQSGTTLTVSYTYTELNPNNVTIRVHNTTHIIGETIVTGLVSGVDVTRSDSVNTILWTTDAAYNVTVILYDLAGQTGIDIQRNAVIIDTTPPIKTVVSPPPGSYLDFSNVWINETLSDATSGIDPLTITMTLNETPVTPNYDPITGLLSYHAIGLADGNHTVLVSIRDLAGNLATNSWWFIVDTSQRFAQISVSANASPALIGFRVQITGWLTWQHNGSGISNAPILLSYSYHPALTPYIPEDKNWNMISTVTTNTDGSYSVTWFAMSSGYYVVEAFYPGTSNVQEATSSTNLLIPGSDDRVFSVSSNSTMSAMNFNSTALELTFTVGGTSGTAGYLDMFLAKSLIPDVSELKIYFDGVEKSYEATSVGDRWFIRLTYTHSTHTVRVSFSSAPTTPATTPILVSLSAIISTILIVITITLLISKHRTKHTQTKRIE